eukprot:1071107-Prymnesium_polylepis.5
MRSLGPRRLSRLTARERGAFCLPPLSSDDERVEPVERADDLNELNLLAGLFLVRSASCWAFLPVCAAGRSRVVSTAIKAFVTSLAACCLHQIVNAKPATSASEQPPSAMLIVKGTLPAPEQSLQDLPRPP